MKLPQLESSELKLEFSGYSDLSAAGNSVKYEFHIAKQIRKKYEFDDELFSISGNVILADFFAVRNFTQKINSKRKASGQVRAGDINGAGLMDEIYHFLLSSYESKLNPGVFKRALDHANQSMGEDVYKLLSEFVKIFPPMDVYKEKITIPDYLASFTRSKSNFEIVVEELILLYFANINKANKNIIELFDENYFMKKSIYKKFVSKLDKFFSKEIKFGPKNQDIFTFFKDPILNYPEDIEAQLDFILDNWGIILKDEFRRRILSGKDLIREDRLIGITGDTQSAVPFYKGENFADSLSLGKSGYKYGMHSRRDYDEPERFTSDTDWMPRVVIMAKNVHVWLDQLSKKYQRHIHRLDQIPDEELDQLARWNFTGLWLIGIWERSGASKKIKHIMGNIDAVASAYSLYDYQIAQDLGGEEAYNNFNERARARGIRLASDMVPNHTGIFSKWIQERPDFFIQLNYPPFPNYSFTGEDLSEDNNIQLRIEDGYWERKDAAVTFQRIDNRTGEVRYIYHGNDGTNMPWNDTAQLDMLKADVREAVIQKIFEVAKRFSIIRFDAAMTLAKKHFSRLWYPEPGTGGDIPTRSDFALTREEFDKLFPTEFWREVVDRINEEMPDTLLLAEAFWLMEGYFVRTLGMHRVYNSAFMHMMMNEENEKYRDLITNTLEFEPEILKRYVNFMSNPDEETAVNQFGMEDKYFGVAVMMVTLPGLPMFAHGQIEGYTEKYGMEYKRAYYEESPIQLLVKRHEREIFPLVQKRYLFSQVQNFWFYDFVDSSGNINENVFAFTNTEGNEKALVFFNNKYDRASGRILHSTPKLVNIGQDKKELQTRSLAEALQLKSDDRIFYMFREHISGLEYLVRGKDIFDNGFNTNMDGFKYKIFLDFNELYDETGDYEKLAGWIGGAGVKSVNSAIGELNLKPLHDAFENIFDNENIQLLIDSHILNASKTKRAESVKEVIKGIENFSETINPYLNGQLRIEKILINAELWVDAVKSLNRMKAGDLISIKGKKSLEFQRSLTVGRKGDYKPGIIQFLLWIVFDQLGKKFNDNIIGKLQLNYSLEKIYQYFIESEPDYNAGLQLIKIISKYEEVLNLTNLGREVFRTNSEDSISKFVRKYKSKEILKMLNDSIVVSYLGVNKYEGIVYFNKERFEKLIDWLTTVTILSRVKKDTEKYSAKFIEKNLYLAGYLKNESGKSGYNLSQFRLRLKQTETKPALKKNKKGKRK